MASTRGRRAVDPEVWCVTLLFVLLLTTWSQLTPSGRAPDEAVHIDLIEHLASGGSYPEHDGRLVARAPITVFMKNYPGMSDRTPEAAPPTGERPTRADLGGDAPTDVTNQIPQHPPLYYQGMGMVLRAARSIGLVTPEDPYARQWALLRLANVALVAPIPLLAWAASKKLGTNRQMASAAACVPLLVPQFAHIGSSINNDNLLVLLGGVLAVLMAMVCSGDRRPRTAIGIGVVTGLALLTKAFAFAFLPWIVIAYGVALVRRSTAPRPTARMVLTPMTIALAGALAIGAWWPLRNVVRHGSPFPSSLDSAFENAPEGFTPDVVWYAQHFVFSLAHRFWGSFGYFMAELAPALVVVATVLFLTVLWAAIVLPRGRATGTSPGRLTTIAYGSIFPIMLALVAYRAVSLYLPSGKAASLHGRYLFGAMTALSVVAGIGAVRLLGRYGPMAILAAAGVLHAASFRVALGTWWAEPDATGHRSLRAMVRWSAWPDLIVYALLGLMMATAAVTAVMLSRTARDGSRDRPRSGPGFRASIHPSP